MCELRRAHPRWGPKRLVFEMGRRGLGPVTRSTVYRVLVRNQLIEPRSRRRRRQDYTRWERPVPMQLWQLDVTASAFLAGGREVKIVTGPSGTHELRGRRKGHRHGDGTPRIVRAAPSTRKGTQRSFLTAPQKGSSGPTLARGA